MPHKILHFHVELRQLFCIKFCISTKFLLSNVVLPALFLFIRIFNRIVFDSRENSAFFSVILTRIQTISFFKIVNFLQMSQIFTFKCRFFALFFSIFTLICIFNRIALDYGENSVFSPVILPRIQTVFFFKIVNFLQISQIFTFKCRFLALLFSIWTLICIFNRIALDYGENSVFSPVILTRIQTVFFFKIVNFLQISQIFTFKCRFFALLFSIWTLICIFNRIALDYGENSVFSPVILPRIQTVFFFKIVNFLQISQIFTFKCRFLALLFSIWTLICIFNRIALDYGENSAFSPVIRIQTVFFFRIVNFLQISQIFTFKCRFFALLFSIWTLICIFSRIALDYGENSAFSPVIRIQTVFFFRIVNFLQISQIFTFKCRFLALLLSIWTLICIFSQIASDYGENSAFSPVIRIQTVFFFKIVNFLQISQILLSNVVLLRSFFPFGP